MEKLSLTSLKTEARKVIKELSTRKISDLYGVTDGKAVGTYVERAFNEHLRSKYQYEQGSAAIGIDFPVLEVDLKVTSITQPQSSCPYRDASQKVYGLGYHLIVLVYEKTDTENAALLNFRHAVFVDKEYTADYQTTYGLQGILQRNGNIDDVTAFLIERNLPLDEIGIQKLATRILTEPPKLGYLTISNALQWRLQYTRIIETAGNAKTTGVENILA